MYRHSLVLKNDVCSPERTPLNNLKGDWPAKAGIQLTHAAGHVGSFRVARTRTMLEISGAIREPHGWTRLPEGHHPEWYFLDHTVVFIDPTHDHTTRRMIAILRNGKLVTEDSTHLVGEEASDILTSPLKAEPLKMKARVIETGDGWRFRLQIAIPKEGPAPAFALRPRGVLGLQIKLGVAGSILHPAVIWPPKDPFWDSNAFVFGDVVDADAKLAITSVDFGKPVWETGPISSSIQLTGRLFSQALEQGLCSVEVISTTGVIDRTDHPWRAQRGAIDFSVPVHFPFTSKWVPSIHRSARLSLTLRDPKGHPLWQAAWPFGFDAGIIVREPFGAFTGMKRGLRRPNPADPDFVAKFRMWLLAQLPAWSYQTTRNGAPSDFYLKARHRADDVDLMDPRVMQTLATLIQTRFDNWQDALCAAAMVLHHPSLTVHSPSWSRIAGASDPGTVMRLGGCFCSDTAYLAARLAEALGPLYGVPLRGFLLGLRGHLSGLVETPIGEVLIDPMLGVYYHTLDNTRLATLAEMRAEPQISERMWAAPRRNGNGDHFFHQVFNHTKKPLRIPTIQYPG